jgi:hypothetical protein
VAVVDGRGRGTTLARVAAAAALALACAADPIRDAAFSPAYELQLVAGDSQRSGGARFPSERLPLEELEAWLRAQVEARERIEAVADGLRDALLRELAAAMSREFGIRTRVLESSETVRSTLLDDLDPRGTFELDPPDGLLVVTLATREVDEGEVGSAVLEAAERISLLGPGEAVSDFHDARDDGYLVCAVRRGDAWIQPLERDCASSMAERVITAIHELRSRR